MDRGEIYYSYLEHFNLKINPFSIIPDPNLFFPAKAHHTSIEVLSYALNQGNIISVLTGVPGIGKTQVVLTLINKLSQDIRPVYIYNPGLKPKEFFQAIFKELNLDEEMEFPENKDEILKRLKRFFKENRDPKKYLIVIDEAQLIPDESLEELRLITNLNEGSEIFVQIFLIGQPILAERLKHPTFAPLRQRINVWEILLPLEKDELFSYIWYRIKYASENPEIFIEEKIAKPLIKWTKGVPRLINKIMDRVLFVTYVKGEKRVSKKYLKEAKKTFPEYLLEAL